VFCHTNRETIMPAESTPFPTSSTPPGTSNPQALRREMPVGTQEGDLERDTALAEHAEERGAASADDLISRIAQGAHQAIDRLAESAAPYLNPLQERVSGAGDDWQARADRAREVTDEWTESLRCTVRENPLASVGIALAVGMLIARLSR